jgi:hypothetical protein
LCNHFISRRSATPFLDFHFDRCRKIVKAFEATSVTKPKNCTTSFVARLHSPFHRAHLPDRAILTLAWCWINKLDGEASRRFSGVSLPTAYEYFRTFRAVAAEVVENLGEEVWGTAVVGGVGQSVQVSHQGH